MTSSDRRRPVGELERAVLIVVIAQRGEGYGVSIRSELEQRLNRAISLGAVYTTLDRLTAKGFVSVSQGDATPQRGGRAKKLFRIEAAGLEALDHARRVSESIWNLAAGEPSR